MSYLYKYIVQQKFLTLAVFSVLVSSCGLNKSYQTPDFDKTDLYRGVETSDTSSFADIPWNEVFTDPLLQALISTGIEGNLDLKMAMSRIQSAEAYLMQQRGGLLPSLSVGATGEFADGGSNVTSAVNFVEEQYQVYGTASWELDVWGKLRSAKRSALADLLAQEASKRAVQTQLVANIASYYYSLLALDEQLRITEETLTSRKEYESTVEELKVAALVTGADLMQSKANRLSAEVMIPDLKQSIREMENALSILLGKSPGPIERASIESQDPQYLLETGVPSMLLSNRPDVQQAEFALRSSFELVKVSRAYFYPSLTLTGTAGYGALDVSDLFDPASWFANLTAGLVQPVFNQNANRARLKTNEANQEIALATYEQTLLTAGSEVSNALYSYQMAEDKIVLRAQQLETLQQAVDFNQELLKSDEAGYVDVLTSEQNLLSAQLSGVEDKLQRLNAIVELYRALGGGWE